LIPVLSANSLRPERRIAQIASLTLVSYFNTSRKLLRHLESADKAHPLELAKYSLERAGASALETDIKQ
jgi:predicted component of type VI protein secretion system